MLTKIFNILLVSDDQNLFHLLKGVLGSVEHKIQQIDQEEKILPALFQDVYHLVVLDQSKRSVGAENLKQLRQSFPELHYIVIAENLKTAEPWSTFSRFSLVPGAQIERRLPSLLSSLYEKFNEINASNLTYFNLIKRALEESPGFVAIVHFNGDIVFLNQQAREILKVQPEEIKELKFFDFLKEGEKVWQFLTMRWNEQKEEAVSIELSMADKHFQEFVLPASIRTVKNGDIYFIMQSKKTGDLGQGGHHSTSETLLKAFSESLANDLLNPVNVIWGRLQLLQANHEFDTEELHNFELIERQLSRINEVINKLTTFTSMNKDLVPQRVFFNDVFKNLLLQPSLQNILQSQNSRVVLNLDSLPPVFGQVAQIELLFITLIDLILKLVGINATITIFNDEVKKGQPLILNFKIEDVTHAPDQVLLKSCLQLNRSEKKKFALETNIIRYLLDEYQVKHDLKEIDSTLILRLVFPIK